MEAAVLMMVEAGDADGALELSKVRAPHGTGENVDWRRVEALTKQLEVGKENHRRSIEQADAARQAGIVQEERVALAKAAGYLPEHPLATNRVNRGRRTYDARIELEGRLERMQMADGSRPDYSIDGAWSSAAAGSL